MARHESINHAEQAALEQAKAAGFYVRSGRTIETLRAWQRWCWQAGRPCVVVRRGTRDGSVTVDGVEVFNGPVEELEVQARRAVAYPPRAQGARRDLPGGVCPHDAADGEPGQALPAGDEAAARLAHGQE